MTANSFFLIKYGDVYSPQHEGINDVLVGAGKILAMEKRLSQKLGQLFLFKTNRNF